jgi:DNA-binding winged helix-turn-helix (wHTH) protein
LNEKLGPDRGASVSFGPFRLFRTERILERDGIPINLRGRTLDIFIPVVERPGMTVSKRELFDRVWPNRVVDESNLRFHDTVLRKALSASQSDSSYVVNVPGRGYVAPVSFTESDQTENISREAWRKSRMPRRPVRAIGRGDAIERVSTQLIALRFVLIVGPSGVGKTTVAVSVGWSPLQAFGGEVFFVDLGAVNDPSLVASAVASSLDVRPTSGDTILALISYLGDRRTLLILDGCERVIDAPSQLAEAIFERHSTSMWFPLRASRYDMKANASLGCSRWPDLPKGQRLCSRR